MALSDLTRGEIEQAIAEFDRLGRAEFLATYAFGPALRYFLLHEGRRYDSKAVVGVAHGYLAGQRALTTKDFSGGLGSAVGVLRRLGYTVLEDTDAGTHAGTATDPYADLLGRVGALTVHRSSGAPLLFQPITLLWSLGRALRGEPRMVAWPETERALVDLLKRHAVRGERPRPDYPVLALYRAGLWELSGQTGPVPPAHGDAALRRWFTGHRPAGGLTASAYDLLHRSAEARAAVLDTLLATYFDGLDPTGLLQDVGLVGDEGEPAEETAVEPASDERPVDPVALAAAYDRMCRRVERYEARGGPRERTATSTSRHRLWLAREAVRERCLGVCENPGCTGQPADTTASGAPILEIDHVVDLGLGGRDHPSNMAALCPNCHAVKTRGRSREELRAVLLEVARKRHAATLAAMT
ncbi:HNH endonuclease signature motif containing protein [Actinacidiphila alni]|uniref:HNH endonuclease signature motif containing protein n=1 Tax=Actinacidiphila alni TaxID=380248 RepID=UPI00345513C9